jgi:hypothetical protein
MQSGKLATVEHISAIIKYGMNNANGRAHHIEAFKMLTESFACTITCQVFAYTRVYRIIRAFAA